MKRAKRTIIILSLALASCRGPMTHPLATITPQTMHLRLLATTSTAPLLQDFIAAYKQPGILLAVEWAAVEWPAIRERLLAGDAHFALTTTLSPDLGWWAAPVGQDGIAIIVHASNDLPQITLDDLRLIFAGQVTTWADLGGPDAPIIVVSREDGADTRLTFEALVMRQQPVTSAARLALSSRTMAEIVAETPGAVGYVSMAFLAQDHRARAIPVASRAGETAFLPTPDTVSAGEYPLRVPILVVGPAPPPDDSFYRDWFAWMQSDEGQAIAGRRYGVAHFR